MKVRDLIRRLKEVNLDAEVLVFSDAEGNDIHSLYTVETDHADGGEPIIYLIPMD